VGVVKYVVTLGEREVEVEVDGDQVTIDGRRHVASLTAVGGTPLRRLVIDGRSVVLGLESQGQGRWGITIGGERWESEVVDQRTRHLRSLAGSADRQRGGGAIRAPMPGLVLRVLVEPGQRVAAGGGVIVLEAMKMENELKAAAAGIVGAVYVRSGEAVEKGQPLVEIEAGGAP
jgi:biotin carboxyl carrier protein